MTKTTTSDDLTRIKGIGQKLAQALIKHDVATFAQLAALDEAAIATLEATGDFKGNNDWAGWIAEAKKLTPASDSKEEAERPVTSDTSHQEAERPVTSDTSHQVVADDPAVKTFDVSFPPPADMPARMLEGALLVVKSKADRGFRRAGYAFTPEETPIPLADLTEAQQMAIANEPELIVKLRLVHEA